MNTNDMSIEILDFARQLRAEIPAGEPLTDAECFRAGAAQLLRRAVDLLGAARAAETRA